MGDMTILYIETSTKNCSVAIAKGSDLLCVCEEFDENYSHAEKLHLFIQWAMEGAEISMQELQGICVSKGPGSYTGLRIGVSAAKGLSYGLDIPLYALNSLEILVQTQKEKGFDLIVPMIDARRMEVYTSLFDEKGHAISSIEAKVLDENSYSEFQDKKVVFVGDCVRKLQAIYRFDNAEFVSFYPSAKDMVSLFQQNKQENITEDVAYFEPFYLKEFISGNKKI